MEEDRSLLLLLNEEKGSSSKVVRAVYLQYASVNKLMILEIRPE